jgi:NAD(P)-dependent dehydrogenase (short-subunit alcohol dehydrogenase family)
MKNYQGRWFVITGAAGGIGRETVRLLVEKEARCLLVDPNAAALAELVQGLPAAAVRRVVSALESPAACEAALGQLESPLYGLVHLAGIFVPESAGPDPRAVYDRVMAANITNAFDLAQAAIARLDRAETTRMVFMSSLAYRRGSMDHVAYSTAKGGITGLVRALARKLAPGALVNGLAPGHIDTAMPEHLWADRSRAERLLAEIPLKRRGHPGEVASVIDFLCGEGASYITGQVINVDGGIISG